MKQATTIWLWLLGALLAGALGWWLFWPRVTPTPVPPVPAAAMPAPEPEPTAQPAAIQHPIPTLDAGDDPAELSVDAAANAAAPALPTLAESDQPLWEALSALAEGDGALALLLREHLIQRLVVTIDNLSQPRISRTAMVLAPVPGELQLEHSADGATTLAPANAQRYAAYVQLFSRIDVVKASALYVRFYPLFQQAYAELGYPDAYFNDRLIQVIDHLLATPEPAQPPQLERDARGRYRFIDPSLESQSVGRKALLRLGSEQAAAVKAQLRKLRSALASSSS